MRKYILILTITAVLVTGASFWLLRAAPPTPPPIQAPTATPNIITAGASTVVLFTVPIPEPTLNPASVNLLRVDANGSSTVVARMLDNGQNGDKTPGDKVFTASVTLTETQPASFGFQVSAAFRGIIRRSLSPNQRFAALAPTTSPVVLPPDPGEEGKETVVGIDSDGDGLRDDVQRYIVLSYPESERKRAALYQVAKANQLFLLQGSTVEGAVAAAEVTIKANECLYAIAGGASLGINLRHALKAELLNTRARSRAFNSADTKLGGTLTGLLPDEGVAYCDFDPQPMRN